MSARDKTALRLGVITALAQHMNNRLGRTGLMKLIFFLQTLKNAQLGYSFRLYTYGPYDGQVLDDLKVAEGLGAVRSKSFEWPGGTGYAIEPTETSDEFLQRSAIDAQYLKPDLEWVINEFGHLSASDLELASTILFFDRHVSQNITVAQLIAGVHAIKPHHSEGKIKAEFEQLASKGYVENRI